MPRIKREPARGLRVDRGYPGGSSTVEIFGQITRWNGVKEAHSFLNDMEVAQMLLDCYDFIGGNALTWTNKDPPSLDDVLQLKQKVEKGCQTLQKIQALMVFPPDNQAEQSLIRKSKRKQTRVHRFIEEEAIKKKECKEKKDTKEAALKEELVDVNCDGDYKPEEENVEDESGNSDHDWETKKQKKTPPELKTQAAKKRGRPRKGEARPKKVPKAKKQRPVKKENLPKKPQITAIAEGDVPTAPPKKKKIYNRVSATLYDCKMCAARLESKEEFKKHYITHTETENTQSKCDINNAAVLSYRCLKCGIITNNMKSHKESHYFKPKMCEICGLILTRSANWFKHKRDHTVNKSEKLHKCKKCSTCFYSLERLKYHVVRHSKERPYICEVCGKAFKVRQKLVCHKYIHAKVKPFVCKFCGKGFTTSYNFRGHLRTHTGEKPFTCDQCPLKFTHNVSLKIHKKKTHAVDLWKLKPQQIIEEFDDVNKHL